MKGLNWDNGEERGHNQLLADTDRGILNDVLPYLCLGTVGRMQLIHYEQVKVLGVPTKSMCIEAQMADTSCCGGEKWNSTGLKEEQQVLW